MFGLFKKPAVQAKAAKTPAKPDRETIKAQAMENARKARAEIGEDNLKRIATLLEAQNRSEGLKARDRIREMDGATVAGHLKHILEDEDRHR